MKDYNSGKFFHFHVKNKKVCNETKRKNVSGFCLKKK